jgi:predicted DNA-binding protein
MAKKITEQREDELMADFALRVLKKIDNGEEELYSASVLLEMASEDYFHNLENITLANEADQVFSSIETGEEKTISSKEFFENAKQRGFNI